MKVPLKPNKLIVWINHLERHRRYQLIITIGVLVSTFIAVIIPEYAFAGALGGVATNLIWIWE